MRKEQASDRPALEMSITRSSRALPNKLSSATRSPQPARRTQSNSHSCLFGVGRSTVYRAIERAGDRTTGLTPIPGYLSVGATFLSGTPIRPNLGVARHHAACR